MKIQKIGGFTDEGYPTGWEILGEAKDAAGVAFTDCLSIDTRGVVRINGIEIVEWTEARNKAMAE